MELEPQEQHILTAALAVYRTTLDRDRALGGVAAEMAETLDPIAARVEAKLFREMYGEAEPAEPDWLGDHHVYVSAAS